MDLNKAQKEELIPYLTEFISENRKKRFDEVIGERMDHMRIVLEDLFQAHNASAVLRSCDCFGVQHVHFIENKNTMKISADVALGSSNWLSIHKHRGAGQNTRQTLELLKKQGYRIVVTSPHANGYTIEDLPVDKKFALVFGTELQGISSEAAELADDFVKIPMYGFTESFNISVCAALCMYELSKRIRSNVKDYRLQPEERTEVYFDWLCSSIDSSEAIIKNYLQMQGS